MRYHGYDSLYALDVDESESAIALVFAGPECIHRKGKQRLVWFGEQGHECKCNISLLLGILAVDMHEETDFCDL